MTEAHNSTRWDDPRIDNYLKFPIMEYLKVEKDWTPERIMDMPWDQEKLLHARNEYELTKEIINDASIYIDDMLQLRSIWGIA